MGRLSLNIFLAFCTVTSGFCSTVAFSQSVSRSEMIDLWIDERHGTQSIYQATPVTQVVPTFNTITFALQGELLNSEITAAPLPYSGVTPEDKLALSGYGFAPHVSLSLKKIGLGFSGEFGTKTSTYIQSPTRFNGNQSTVQESSMTYRGFGLNTYYILPQPFGKKVKPSLTVGYSAFSAKHSTSAFVNSIEAENIPETQKEQYTYNVSRQEIGLNVGVQLLKKFSLVPWINYENIDTSDARSKADDAERAFKLENSAIFREDVELFWHSKPRFRYGVDFVIRTFGGFDIHFGGLLGAVASFGGGNDRIEDNSYSLSLSLEQKGN